MRDLAPQSWKNQESHYLAVLDSPWYRSLVELQDVLTVGTFEFFSRRGLRAMQLPLTTHSISSPMGLGSDSSPVEIELFGVHTFLADSMQFMLEYGTRLAQAPGCYYVLPSFRGEAADERHLCQFYHSEAEIAGGLDDVIALVEEYVLHLTTRVLAQCGAAISTSGAGAAHLEALLRRGRPFPRISFPEAARLLADRAGDIQRHSAGFDTLTREGERHLMKQFGGCVWVSEFDQLAVPFYQARSADGRRARAADLLMGIGEVVGAGERHETGGQARAALAEHGVDAEPYEWYLEMKDRYPLKTAGFGLGTERFLLWVLGHDDIRDCQVLPRFNGLRAIP